MFARGDSTAITSKVVMLLLVFCAFGTLLHTVSEGLPIAASFTGAIPAALAESSFDIDEHNEDLFLSLSLPTTPAMCPQLCMTSTGPSGVFSYSILPQLPPPN